MNQQGVDDTLPKIWYTIDFNDVDRTLTEIENGNLENRPIIYGIETNILFSNNYDSSSNGEVQVASLNFTLYTIVNNSFDENYKRKQLLNRLASEIKYKFDNYGSNLPHFRNLRVNLPDGMLTRDSDNTYSARQEIYAEIYKKVR